MNRTFLPLALALGATVVLCPAAARAQGDSGDQGTSSTGGGGDTNATNATNGSAGSSTGSAGSSTGSTAITPSTGGGGGGESITDVLENKGQSYYFLGVNYRLNIVPQFIVGLFVDEGQSTFVTSTVGISLDVRKDHFSIVPGLNFSEYGFDPVLFLQKNKDPSDPGNWGLVHSTLKAIYLTVDLLWSVPIAKKGQVDFEFGFSAGLGGVFGDLYNTWVSHDAGAGGPQYQSKASGTFYECSAITDAQSFSGTAPQGCNTSNHQNATIAKVGNGNKLGYREPNWFDNNGGSVPTVFPWLSLPILGFRFKPIKELEMRLNGGFSITGFFVNFAAYYGFESPKSTPK
jgi:hypothetical protein